MRKKKEILYYLPFVVLFLAELVIHWKIDLNVTGGDDAVFLAYSQEPGYSLISWLAERYMTWSSRTLIEAVLMVMVNLPHLVWRVADSAVVALAALFLTRLLERREYREYYSFFISLMFLALPYSYMSLAGWITTSVNYMWPAAAALAALYPIRQRVDGNCVTAVQGVICTVLLLFAGTSEQTAFVLFASYGCYGLYLLWDGQGRDIFRKYKYILLQFVLSGMCMAYILLCPGNRERSAFETEKWLPQFASYSLFDKLETGVSVTIKSIFVQENAGFFVLAFLLAALVWQNRRQTACRVLALVPAAIMLIFTQVRRMYGADDPFLNLNTLDGLCLIGVCGLVLLGFFFLFGREMRMYLISLLFLVALATKTVIGFSPTVHASGERTSWIMNILFVGCAAVLLSKWDFRNKAATLLLTLSVVCLCSAGIVMNFHMLV